MKMCPSEGASELEKLFIHNFGLVVSQAVSFKPSSREEMDEFVQAGSVGMLKALKRYDPKRGRLSTYCIFCIRKAIELYIRKQRKYEEICQLESDIAYNYSERLEDYLPDTIGDIEKRLLNMSMEGYSYKQIAKKTGINRDVIRNIMNQIYANIREVNEENIDG